MGSWPPRDGPPHPIDAYDRRVARLLLADRQVGALMVVGERWWEREGRAVATRWINPTWTAEVWLTVDDEFSDPSYVAPEDLARLIDELDHGRFTSPDGRIFAVEWIDGVPGVELSRREFGVHPERAR
ncbi:hypothetical protein [Nocardioides sp.]|uniref:hypothetical protein n=1 Tax=Nocardioides sp. TaxID=35761 RepID=UPI0035127557